VVPYALGSCSFPASSKHHLNNLALWSFYSAFLGHLETGLHFGGLDCILLVDDGFVQDSADFFDPRGIRQDYRSSGYDCYFPSFVFFPRLMALGSYHKLVF
jgi:hypothetical protein